MADRNGRGLLRRPCRTRRNNQSIPGDRAFDFFDGVGEVGFQGLGPAADERTEFDHLNADLFELACRSLKIGLGEIMNVSLIDAAR
ncbi:MAG: hypothetical protein FKY71_19250 [Spiribacter salinus]|uniref:Uncharacterized protein n=1 Tax=Spiribacter salinus TaxID=1335746 RepID=A0A540V7P9_9GAMM|nr:MAG: hypothetical protein FKY71_19250 [Spiribacter salinus]